MDNQTIEQIRDLITTYENLIKVQNDVIREKEERIIMLKKYIELQEIEKELNSLVHLNQICLN